MDRYLTKKTTELTSEPPVGDSSAKPTHPEQIAGGSTEAAASSVPILHPDPNTAASHSFVVEPPAPEQHVGENNFTGECSRPLTLLDHTLEQLNKYITKIACSKQPYGPDYYSPAVIYPSYAKRDSIQTFFNKTNFQKVEQEYRSNTKKGRFFAANVAIFSVEYSYMVGPNSTEKNARWENPGFIFSGSEGKNINLYLKEIKELAAPCLPELEDKIGLSSYTDAHTENSIIIKTSSCEPINHLIDSMVHDESIISSDKLTIKIISRHGICSHCQMWLTAYAYEGSKFAEKVKQCFAERRIKTPDRIIIEAQAVPSEIKR
jgi:hypothetical protein